MERKEIIRAEEYTYTVIFEPDEEAGGYVVTCPALPGLVTEGDTLDDARAMAADAIRGYLQSLQKEGLPLPPSERYETAPIRAWVAPAAERSARAGGSQRP